MPEAVSKTELLRALGRLSRGLSAVFWGLPLALVVCVQTAKTEWFRPLGFFPAMVANGLLFYGLHLLGSFQKQERPWRHSLERAKLLALVNVGLAPFLLWWHDQPREQYYGWMVLVLALAGLLFLMNLNWVLRRLAAMLPDETLRQEVRLFTTLNLYLLLFILMAMAFFFFLGRYITISQTMRELLNMLAPSRPWLLLLLVLLPLAMTMALTWKIKEVILSSVFDAEG